MRSHIDMTQTMILITGCTAGGKGKLALEIARRCNGCILSIDSMKVYRRMDIGTAKPSAADRAEIPHYLIDVVEPAESFSLGRYVELADAAIVDIQKQGRPVIAVGGTAMYIRGLLEGIFDGPPAEPDLRRQLTERAAREGQDVLYRQLQQCDPAAAERIHRNDLKRIVRGLEVYTLTGKPISSFQHQFGSGSYRYPFGLIGLRRPVEQANHRINQRVKRMIEDGLVAEVQSLLAEPDPLSPQAAQALGYTEIIAHLHGEMPLGEAVERIKINTRRFAKGQRTWFRSFAGMRWFDVNEEDTPEALADGVLDELNSGMDV